jgi:hypothetical protein
MQYSDVYVLCSLRQQAAAAAVQQSFTRDLACRTKKRHRPDDQPRGPGCWWTPTWLLRDLASRSRTCQPVRAALIE